MASAESDSEEEFSAEESDSDNFDSDMSEVSDCFLECMSSFLDQHEEPDGGKSDGNFSEAANTEDENSLSCKENSKLPKEKSSSQDPGEKKLSRSYFVYNILNIYVILQLTLWLYLCILELRRTRQFLDNLSMHVFRSLSKAK